MIYFDNFPVEQSHFPDNTLHPIFNNLCSFEDGHRIDWFYEDDSELFTLICMKGWCDDNEPHVPVDLFIPYCPHARMDRVKKDNDVFTLKYFCKVINNLNFRKVVIIDPHSSVVSALLDRVTIVNPVLNIFRVIDETQPEVLFFPDEGAAKRYVDVFNMPYTVGMKQRNWETGKIESLVLMNPEMVAGKRVLIVDDICSYGGTFARAGEALREAGAASVNLYVTHCEPNIIKGRIYTEHPSPIDHIYTTDTLLVIPVPTDERMSFVAEYRPEEEEEDEND